jgi:hypothetical protein
VEFGNPTFLLEGGEPLDEMVHRSRVSWMLEEAHTPAKQPSVDFAMQDVSKPLSIFARLRESVTVSVTDRIWTAEAFALSEVIVLFKPGGYQNGPHPDSDCQGGPLGLIAESAIKPAPTVVSRPNTGSTGPRMRAAASHRG